MATGKPDPIPDAIGTVTGWRAWVVAGDPPRLTSVIQPQVWLPRERMEAQCHTRHFAPDANCSCGLYAARTQDHLVEMRYHRYHDDDFAVVGEVALWGTIVEGTQGWRAQFGYPRCLLIPFVAWRVAAALRNDYGVRTELANTLALGQKEA